jgi:hypothetical protein
MSDYGSLSDHDLNVITLYPSSLATDYAFRMKIVSSDGQDKGGAHLTLSDARALISLLEKAIHDIEKGA